LLLPLAVVADAASAPTSNETTQPTPENSTQTRSAQDEANQSLPEETQPEDTQSAPELPFDPALIGLPEFPWPLAAPNDFQQALERIDERLAELRALLETATVEAAVARGLADAPVDSVTEGGDAEPVDLPEETEREETGKDVQDDAVRLEAAVNRIEQRIEALQELRITVQRHATLRDRLVDTEAALQVELERTESPDAALEPPFPVSLLDQLQAELAVKEAVETIAETRIAAAERRKDAAERALNQAVRDRRATRDRRNAAEAGAGAPADLTALDEALELARLNDLLAREHLAAVERGTELARIQDDLAEAEQALIVERIRFLEDRVSLPQEALQEQLAKLDQADRAMRGDLVALQRLGDEAEAAVFQAQRRLAAADADAETVYETGSETGFDQAALREWVVAHQTELTAARASADSLAIAMDLLSRMQTYWELRYQVMNDPDAVDVADLVKQVIKDLAQARGEKESILERLNSLRSIQLAHGRRARDPALSEGVREAMEVRRAAHDLAERHGRELLETQDELIALLQGLRYQLDSLLKERYLSLELLQARETLAGWWDAEVLVIDDQSIRVRELITALAMFIVVLVAVSLIRGGARRALKRRKVKSPNTEYGDLRLVLSAIAGNTNLAFVLIAAFYVAMIFSGLASPTVEQWLWTALVIAFYAQLGIWANAAMLDYFTRRRTRQEMRDPSTVTGYGLLTFFVRVGIWLTVAVSLLAYFKYPIAGLVGALGVGSLAVAFAVQNILGDVFSSMAIILDKPFRVGDFVKAGETLGTIEHIGVKTTRIRSLSGEQIVLSNSDLLNSRVHNFKQFKERRIAFRLGVIYQTPRALLERIPDMLREAVDETPRTRFDRAHFAEYGDFALTFEIVYYVLSPDYTVYMDVQQAINLGIHRRFEDAGISFAYPTQEVILRYAAAQPTEELARR
jgi:small-conductance mechanosensitive channel